MSKMGISTYQSYCGAQIFDAVGLRQDFVDQYFTGTHTRIEGVGLAEIAEETVRRHRDAFGDAPVYAVDARRRRRICRPHARRGPRLDRRDASRGCSTRCAAIRRTRTAPSPRSINEQSRAAADHPRPVRDQDGGGDGRKPVPLEEVEPAKKSSSASRPAPCRSARSRARRTPRSRSP